jgi:zinc transport system permease protein
MEAFLQFAFLRHAVLAAVLSAVACGVVGTLVVVNRLSSLAGGIAHACFGGLGLAFLAGFDPVLGALAFGLASSVGIGTVTLRAPQRADAAVAAMWAVGMALGLVFVKLAPGYAPDLLSYLFGSILAVSPGDLWFLAAAGLIVLLFVTGLYKELRAISFDPGYARTRGLPVGALYIALLCVTGCAVVALMRTVGLIMVIAMLSIPPSIARIYCRSLGWMMVLSSALCALFGIAGIALAWWLDIPAGAAIILSAAAGYALTSCVSALRHRKPRRAA